MNPNFFDGLYELIPEYAGVLLEFVWIGGLEIGFAVGHAPPPAYVRPVAAHTHRVHTTHQKLLGMTNTIFDTYLYNDTTRQELNKKQKQCSVKIKIETNIVQLVKSPSTDRHARMHAHHRVHSQAQI